MTPEAASTLVGRVGRVRRGEHTGMYVQVEPDAREPNAWHIWLLKQDPRSVSPSDGWDIWADTISDLEEWLSSSCLDVEWLD